jgi:hypothetical protein
MRYQYQMGLKLGGYEVVGAEFHGHSIGSGDVMLWAGN